MERLESFPFGMLLYVAVATLGAVARSRRFEKDEEVDDGLVIGAATLLAVKGMWKVAVFEGGAAIA